MNKAGKPRSLWLIVNGKQGEVEGLRDGVETLRKRGHCVGVRLTWEAGDAKRYTLRAAENGADTVVAAGGDGTVHEVVNGLVQAGAEGHDLPALAVLPLGTANDFAVACGLPAELPRALQRLPDMPVVRIDLGRVNGQVFVNLASGGFGTQVTSETPEEMKHLLGSFAYFLTGLTRFSSIKPVAAKLRGPEFNWEGELLVLAVGNGRQAGGGNVLCPDASLNDGLLDVGVLPPPPEGEFMGALRALMREGRGAVPGAMARARLPWLEVEAPEGLHFNLDGEPMEGDQFRFEVLPKAIRMHLPEKSPVVT